MKKKLTINEIESSVEKVTTAADANATEAKKGKSDKTPVKFNKRGKKKIKHLKLYITLGVLVVVFTVLGFFGWSLYSKLSQMFAGNTNLFSLFAGQQLKGENSGRVNILLLGVGDDGHAGQQLSDTNMVISYDVKTKQAAMISIPRDLYVKIGSYGSAKLNAAHAYGEYYKYPGGGPALAEKTVSEVLGIPIHYYARVDFTGLKDMIDAVGGIDITVDEDLYDYLYPTDDGLNGALYIKKGKQHMDGITALRYSRSRETTSDFDRAKRQQKVLMALKDKVMSVDTFLNPTKISDIASALGKHLKTDFSVNEIPRGIELFKGVDTAKIKNKVFDNSAAGLLIDDSSEGAGYTLIPRAGIYNYSAIQAVAQNIFEDQSVQTEAADISVQNGTTRSGLASNVAAKLTKAGYNVVDISTADNSAYSQTKIVDYSGGAKPGTIAALEKLFSVSAAKSTDQSSSGADIEVIIGANYTTN